MKKLLFFLIIPLALYAQEVFSASYNQSQGRYSTQSQSSYFMQQNNTRLRNEVIDYNQALPEDMKRLQRMNKSSFNNDEYSNPVPWGQEEYSKQNIMQHKQPSPSDNTLQIQRETPSWWRQEGSYQGWGFD